MTTITTEQIKELRDITGVSVMQCKKALEEAGGDKEKAIVILQKHSKSAAEKKSDRTLGSGVVKSYIHNTGMVGAMVELSCETDFVARNPEFSTLAYDIAMHIAATNPKFLKKEDVSENDIKAAKEVFTEEVKDKPENMREKILQGKLDSFLKDKILFEQTFIKDPETTIRGLIERGVQKFGENIAVARFVRFGIGE